MKLERVDDLRWRLPMTGAMRVPGLVYADERMARQIEEDRSLEQVANVATLPGIVRASLAMPDIHQGYGFPIGGVAAFRTTDGVVSPGGIGFDINCGTRIVLTGLHEAEVRARVEKLADQLFRDVPAGLGSRSSHVTADLDALLRDGARRSVADGFGWPEDLETIEGGGALAGADPAAVSERAKQRGRPQAGSLGSGNHFCEVQAVEAIYDADVARAFGIDALGQVVVFLHTGSRGLGHQVCDDQIRLMDAAAKKYGIALPDRQLACAPIDSPEARAYLAAMTAAANFAFANRQCITHFVREAFARVFGKSARDLGMRVLYDVAHNIAKFEEHAVDGRRERVLVHRKGATRAFPPGHPDVAERYRAVGQPVLIPGDMGRYSYVLVGTEAAMRETFGSTCHGAGRRASRHEAVRELRGVDVAAAMRAKGVTVRVRNKKLLAEEASEAYKDVADVVDVVHRVGIARRVARLRPLAVIKG